MDQIEIANAMTVITCNLPEIAKQLKIANELKILELKLKYQNIFVDNKIDNIVSKVN